MACRSSGPWRSAAASRSTALAATTLRAPRPGGRAALARLAGERLFAPCLACYHVVTRVYRDVFAVPLPVTLVPLEDWLLE